MPDPRAWSALRRLGRWLEPFRDCFGHQAQWISLQAYVEGVLSDSPRKTMQGMLERLTAPVTYQAFQHFITHAPWDSAVVWRRLLSVLPERKGILILDDTGFPKQGRHSVGVTRQYSGTMGKVGNCQVAVTAALWTGVRAWLVGAELYLPEEWLSPDCREDAGIPKSVTFQEKWRLGLTLVRRVRAAGVKIDAVVSDSGYGEVTTLRRAFDRLRLTYAVGISSSLTVFPITPRWVEPPDRTGGRPAVRKRIDPRDRPISVGELARVTPNERWKRVRWRNGKNRAWEAEFTAMRVTPAQGWRKGRLAEEVWLLCERSAGANSVRKLYFSNLPATARLNQLVRLAHHRWAIEQKYRDLKTELGMDHFEGRSYPGWHHHIVLCAVAHAFIQKERMRRQSGPSLSFRATHAAVQEVFTGLFLMTNAKYARWFEAGLRLKKQLRI